jgi:hypothetical protein
VFFRLAQLSFRHPAKTRLLTDRANFFARWSARNCASGEFGAIKSVLWLVASKSLLRRAAYNNFQRTA